MLFDYNFLNSYICIKILHKEKVMKLSLLSFYELIFNFLIVKTPKEIVYFKTAVST